MHGAIGRVITAPWGQAFLLPELDQVYDLNLLWITGEAAGLDAAGLDAAAERVLGGAGLRHRRLLIEDRHTASTLGEGLHGLGYEESRHRYLAYAGAPPPAPCAAVEEVAIDDVVAGMDVYLQTAAEAPYGQDDRTREQLLQHARRYGSAGADERCFAVRRNGDVVAWAKLWTAGGIAQVEDVVCRPEHRGRGYGRDVVAAATRAALAERARLLFIVADAADWPKDLYRRLGYAPIGDVALFLRHAQPTG